VDRRERTVLQSLFVDGEHHRRGTGRRLVEHFEQTCRDTGVTRIKVAATLLAVPFYQALGYRRSTGVRTMGSGGTRGLIYQPMIKMVALESTRRCRDLTLVGVGFGTTHRPHRSLPDL